MGATEAAVELPARVANARGIEQGAGLRTKALHPTFSGDSPFCGGAGSVVRSTLRRMDCSLRIGFGHRVDLLTQDAPGDVGAQFFAADLAAGQSLDVRAVLSGNTASRIAPLADCGLRHPQRVRQRYLGSQKPGGAF